MYKNLEAQLHDIFWNQEDILSEQPLLEQFYQKKPALEIGCGSGRLLLPLLQHGHPIEGVEVSSDMVDLLHNEAEKLSLNPVIHTTDICQFSPTTSDYQRVSIPAFTAQLFDRPTFSQVLRQIQDFTTTDALLYLTLFIPWAEITGELHEGDWYLDHQAPLSNGCIASCKTKFSINRLQQTLTRHHLYTISQASEKKQQHRSQQTLQWYFYPELKLILKEAGWQIKTLITDLDAQNGTPDPDAHILTLIAHKL